MQYVMCISYLTIILIAQALNIRHHMYCKYHSTTRSTILINNNNKKTINFKNKDTHEIIYIYIYIDR